MTAADTQTDVQIVDHAMFAELDRLAAENERLRAALWAMTLNAEAWHGPPPNMGHVRALAVIAKDGRAALAGGVGDTAAPRALKATGDEPLDVVNSGAEDWVGGVGDTAA